MTAAYSPVSEGRLSPFSARAEAISSIIDSGARNLLSSGSTRPGQALFSAKAESILKSEASLHSFLRHCSIQVPMMFLSSLIFPSSAPSFVRFASIAVVLVTGSGLMVPRSDHVPDERKSEEGESGHARTADAVSCVGARMNPAFPVFSGPSIVPLMDIGRKMRSGSPSARMSSMSHSAVPAFTSPVVVAFVYSCAILPVSR